MTANPGRRLCWLLTALGVAGALLNALGVGLSFAIWIVANFGWIAVNIRRQSWPEVALFSAYLITATIGLFTWGFSPPPVTQNLPILERTAPELPQNYPNQTPETAPNENEEPSISA